MNQPAIEPMPQPENKPKPPPATTPQAIRNRAAFIGFATAIVGLIGYDWRVAMIVSGVALLIAAIVGTAISDLFGKR